MARPTTNALNYYNRDVKDDDNLQYVEAVHGLIGYAVVDKLWKHIYGGPGGYYCEWSQKNQMLFCKNNGITLDQLTAILNTCFEPEIQIFSREQYEQNQILTSSGIQKRWRKIVTEAGRRQNAILPEFELNPIRENITAVELSGVETTPPPTFSGGFQGVSGVNPILETPQSKVKESKVKESKEGGKSAAPLAHPVPNSSNQGGKKANRGGNSAPGAKKSVPPAENEAIEFFQKATEGVWRSELAQMEAKKFIAHYQANGWVQNKGKAIVDWKAAANGWILRDLDGKYRMENGRLTTAAVQLSGGITDSKSISKDVEFLYQRFLEGQLNPKTVKPEHYDYLKTVGLANVSNAVRDNMLAEARKIRAKQLEGSNEGSVIRLHSAYVDGIPLDQEPVKSDSKNLYAIAKYLTTVHIFEEAKSKKKAVLLKSDTE